MNFIKILIILMLVYDVTSGLKNKKSVTDIEVSTHDHAKEPNHIKTNHHHHTTEPKKHTKKHKKCYKKRKHSSKNLTEVSNQIEEHGSTCDDEIILKKSIYETLKKIDDIEDLLKEIINKFLGAIFTKHLKNIQDKESVLRNPLKQFLDKDCNNALKLLFTKYIQKGKFHDSLKHLFGLSLKEFVDKENIIHLKEFLSSGINGEDKDKEEILNDLLQVPLKDLVNYEIDFKNTENLENILEDFLKIPLIELLPFHKFLDSKHLASPDNHKDKDSLVKFLTGGNIVKDIIRAELSKQFIKKLGIIIETEIEKTDISKDVQQDWKEKILKRIVEEIAKLEISKFLRKDFLNKVKIIILEELDKTTKSEHLLHTVTEEIIKNIAEEITKLDGFKLLIETLGIIIAGEIGKIDISKPIQHDLITKLIKSFIGEIVKTGISKRLIEKLGIIVIAEIGQSSDISKHLQRDLIETLIKNIAKQIFKLEISTHLIENLGKHIEVEIEKFEIPKHLQQDIINNILKDALQEITKIELTKTLPSELVNKIGIIIEGEIEKIELSKHLKDDLINKLLKTISEVISKIEILKFLGQDKEVSVTRDLTANQDKNNLLNILSGASLKENKHEEEKSSAEVLASNNLIEKIKISLILKKILEKVANNMNYDNKGSLLKPRTEKAELEIQFGNKIIKERTNQMVKENENAKLLKLIMLMKLLNGNNKSVKKTELVPEANIKTIHQHNNFKKLPSFQNFRFPRNKVKQKDSDNEKPKSTNEFLDTIAQLLKKASSHQENKTPSNQKTIGNSSPPVKNYFIEDPTEYFEDDFQSFEYIELFIDEIEGCEDICIDCYDDIFEYYISEY